MNLPVIMTKKRVPIKEPMNKKVYVGMRQFEDGRRGMSAI
jgi:hypothetical protein